MECSTDLFAPGAKDILEMFHPRHLEIQKVKSAGLGVKQGPM